MLSKPTIFIVDDDAAVLDALQLLFESVGLNVETYESGRAFLKSIDPLRKGCLVTDYSMPVMNGLELHAHLSKRQISLPTILLTGHADVPIAVRALKAGVVDIVEKPFDVQSLLQKVCDALATVSTPAKSRAKSKFNNGFDAPLPAPALAPERARLILASMADGVITTDGADRIEYLNPLAEKLTGWSFSESFGRPLADVFKLLDGSDESAADKPAHESESDSASKYRVLVRRDGRTLTITRSVAPVYDEGQERGTVIVFHDITLTQRKIRDLTYAATHDPLTGLVNRREFMRRLEQTLLRRAAPQSAAHALCYLDLDRFKGVNDDAGHLVGDLMLCRITELLRERIRARDTLARLGGDEFGLLLEHCPVSLARRIAGDLVEAVTSFRFSWEDKVLTVGLSIGVIAITETSGSIEKVLQDADSACYKAKRQGGARVYVDAE